MDDKALIREAFEARKMSYSPYSGYMVGAALLAKNGKVYRGCNIESSSYTPTNCAERTAFFKAISEGVHGFTAIAVVGAQQNSKPEEFGFAYPCGVCRQVMMEFCNPETFRILTAKSEDDYTSYTLRELLPNGFGPGDLNKEVNY
ncbi:cytidine deaminase [Hydrogenoanaerobacterium saccharovorans]|uniref:Cytidine deaminase n=1 Tax=Hydrogenoanaerobacterium saccharovorans TaxID=474960 RepID=A0A1H8B2B9_9FIRM|nr:cytidine deaminase [Hydrogenoanaerobacterium saccharovorans]RPF47623.1 cytidine deaminase [Hydrogenoanaerobacterium saccharovorans]SEM77075.1 cytidine deaminase [Hydrogenoanaerobacterium saccharovorans]